VLVIAPAVPETFVPVDEEVKVIRFGVLKFARFSRLKISARNCTWNRLLIGITLKTEKSSLWKPGPGTCVTPPKA